MLVVVAAVVGDSADRLVSFSHASSNVQRGAFNHRVVEMFTFQSNLSVQTGNRLKYMYKMAN